MEQLKTEHPGKPAPVTGFAHFQRACCYTLQGVQALWKEVAFRQEVYAAIVLLPLPWILKFGVGASATLNILWILVMVVEMLNTAIEAILDLVSPNYHPLAKVAKDLGSAAVGFTCLCNAIAWGAAVYLRIHR